MPEEERWAPPKTLHGVLREVHEDRGQVCCPNCMAKRAIYDPLFYCLLMTKNWGGTCRLSTGEGCRVAQTVPCLWPTLLRLVGPPFKSVASLPSSPWKRPLLGLPGCRGG